VPAGKPGSFKGLNDNYGDYSLSRLIGLPFAYPSPPIQHLSWVEGCHRLRKTLSSFPRFSGCQVRVLCITAMFPLSTTMQSLIDAWEEAQSSGQWQEPQPEPAYPAAWWLIQLEEEPQEHEPPLRWSV
jgi:hypothetical protein